MHRVIEYSSPSAYGGARPLEIIDERGHGLMEDEMEDGRWKMEDGSRIAGRQVTNKMVNKA